MANEKPTEEMTLSELDQSLWQAVTVFVRRCGGDVDKAQPDEREAFEEALAAWAVLALEDAGE